jgi:hypothetical protein
MSGSELREIGLGVLGYAFMGKAHSNAYRKLVYIGWRPPLGATFEDGCRATEVCDAIGRAAKSGRREEIAYR